jgi:hypothetical protein
MASPGARERRSGSIAVERALAPQSPRPYNVFNRRIFAPFGIGNLDAQRRGGGSPTSTPATIRSVKSSASGAQRPPPDSQRP